MNCYIHSVYHSFILLKYHKHPAVSFIFEVVDSDFIVLFLNRESAIENKLFLSKSMLHYSVVFINSPIKHYAANQR